MKRLKMEMLDPLFGAGSTHTATAKLTIAPSGLACSAELWLSRNGTTKDATSGKIPFVSTGASQNISCPVTMPSEGGYAYRVYFDIEIEGTPVLAFVATEDVLIPSVSTPEIVW